MTSSPPAFSTPNNQTTPNLPTRITQSPSSSNDGSGTDTSLNGLNLLSSVCSDNVYSPSLQIYDDGLTSQAPVPTSPTQAIVPAITQTSPGPNRLPSIALFQECASKKRQCSTTTGANIEKKHKSWKGMHNSKTSMMLFLREERIRHNADDLGGQAFSTNGLMRRCYNGFGRCKEGASYLPFNKLQQRINGLSSARVPLSVDHHRLLFEDFVELKPGTEVVLLISRQNHYLKDSRSKKLFEEELTANPLLSRVISGKRYFAFNAIVSSNPKSTDFINSNFTKQEIAHLCGFHEGVAIRFDLKVTKKSIHFFHFDYFQNMDTIQIWGTHSIERLALIQQSFYKNDFPRVGAIVSTFADELEGDVALSTMLAGYYQKFVAVEKMKLQQEADLEEGIATSRLHDVICVPHNRPAFEEFRDLVESSIKTAIYSLYGQFSEFTKPVITQDMLRTMENSFRCLLPIQYHCIRSMMGKEQRKDPEQTTPSQEIKERQWDRFTFFTFIQQCRIRNPHNFVWFSLVNTASHFSGGRNHISLHFGFSIAKNTMLRKLNDMYSYPQIVQKSKSTLDQFKTFVIAIFDNSQFNIKKKFQQNATSSNMAEATCRLFLQPTISEYLEDIPDRWSDLPEIPITYLDQVIPSPYGMPPFEDLSEDWTISDLTEDAFSTFNKSIDASGRRVQAYYDVKRVLGFNCRLKRILPYSMDHPFAFSINRNNDTLVTFSVCDKLRDNWRRTIPSDTANVHCSWYHHLLKSLYSHTKVWRGEPAPAKLLIPAVSPENETTNKGAANVVMSLLLYHGIVEPTSSDGANGDVKGMRLAPDYHQRHVMLVGDGLSQIRVKTFENMIQESSYQFKENFCATDMVRKALGQVIHVTGDLHGGRFHFLAAIYSLFYGSFIQFIQLLLGWKRIRGTDVTKCYQQAAGLILMAADEVEKVFVSSFLHEVLFSNAKERDKLCREGNPKEFGLLIAKGYRKWLKEKQRNSTDEVFRMLVNFVLMVDDYREFRMALNTGDAVMIEGLYRDFLPKFYLTKKKHYVEIILTQIKNFYNKIGPRKLQLVRINRTAPLYGGCDAQGVPMANWSLDGIIELIQKYYHQMRFSTEKGSSTHSPHVMLTNKAMRFAQTEYNRLKSNSDKDEKWMSMSDDIDPSNNRSNTAVNCRAKEHLAIANYLNILEVGIEKPGRKYAKSEFIDALSKVEIRLEDEDEDARARRRMEEARSEDEGVMASIIDELFSDAEGCPDDRDGGRRHVDLSVELDAANIARDGEEVGEEEDDEEEELEDEVAVRSGSREVIVGSTQRPIGVRLANVNELCFVDIELHGRRLIERRNPEVTRFNSQQRRMRKSDFFLIVHANLERTDDSEGIFNVAFNRLKN